MALHMYPANIEVRQKELTLSQQLPNGETATITIALEQIDTVCELLFRAKMAMLGRQSLDPGAGSHTDGGSSDVAIGTPPAAPEIPGGGGFGEVPANASTAATSGNGGTGKVEPDTGPATIVGTGGTGRTESDLAAAGAARESR